METSNTKFQRLWSFLILTLLFSLIVTAQNVPDCCRQRTCSCRIYDLLHGSGNHAAGILTLGKRKSTSPALQTRLYRLLHASGNHAAGILTMGKREEPEKDNGLLGNTVGAGLHPASQIDQSQAPQAACTTKSELLSHKECQEQFLKNCRKEQTVLQGN
ncbi:hypothetical protein NDU88_002327 [Pleurodeles waltl]|uniref:Hypocretin neuropeptide precursor n=1 Tax=Pleurodeles waltl TaxID=8319 RepID=A0AAV7QCB9_PLEWA|nr:hypothetical protein NDU88_002327 [Pleurodeles waltl]